jgi:SAM-dependent methyltransferase
VSFDHFTNRRPTRFGSWLARRIQRTTLDLAGLEDGVPVLEIGPGRGHLAAECLRRGHPYTAIEPDPRLAAALEERGAEVVRSSVPPVPDLQRRFGGVLAVMVLEHVAGADQALEVVRGCKDLLAPGGRLVLSTPDYSSARHHFFNCDYTHSFPTTMRRLLQLCENAGLERVDSRLMSGPFAGPAGLALGAVAARLPFGLLQAWCPASRRAARLYSLQLSLLRRIVLVCRPAEP